MNNCLFCKKEFKVKTKKKKFCSIRCCLIARKKRLIVCGGFQKGVNYNLKKKNNFNNLPRGKDHWNWQGGISGSRDRKNFLYKNWRISVFKRDNYTCQDCKKKEEVSGKLEAHHIRPWAIYKKLRYEIDNGLTLCKECHTKTNGYKSKNIAFIYQGI